MTVELFVELLHSFYEQGWMRGTGGAMAVRQGNTLIVSPSSLQKDRMKSVDLFVYNLEAKSLSSRPPNARISVSSCGVLFTLIMSLTGTQCVIHTHSKAANLITQLLKDEDAFEISHQEYIKGRQIHYTPIRDSLFLQVYMIHLLVGTWVMKALWLSQSSLTNRRKTCCW